MNIGRWLLGAAAVAGIGVGLASCTNIGYYSHSLAGGAKILAQRRSVEKLLRDPELDERRIEQLSLARDIRNFASAELGLPDNRSYRTYVDLGRPYAVWNVVAAREFSVRPETWCFPIAGCVSYRGYFSEKKARAFAADLERDAFEVQVGGVTAYSTIGWFADPLLNTFIALPEAQLAGLLFHELAHQVVYVKDDTTFNESFATAVELEGVRRWMDLRQREAETTSYLERKRRGEDFTELVLEYRDQLAEVYDADRDDGWKRQEKERVLDELRAAYEALKRDQWNGYSGYDTWFGEGLNNARLATIGAYHDLVPGFAALLASRDGDLASFYEEVRELADMTSTERRRYLAQQIPPPGPS